MRERKKERGRRADSGWHTRSFFHPQNRDEEIESGGGRIAPGEEGGGTADGGKDGPRELDLPNLPPR